MRFVAVGMHIEWTQLNKGTTASALNLHVRYEKWTEKKVVTNRAAETKLNTIVLHASHRASVSPEAKCNRPQHLLAVILIYCNGMQIPQMK